MTTKSQALAAINEHRSRYQASLDRVRKSATADELPGALRWQHRNALVEHARLVEQFEAAADDQPEQASGDATPTMNDLIRGRLRTMEVEQNGAFGLRVALSPPPMPAELS